MKINKQQDLNTAYNIGFYMTQSLANTALSHHLYVDGWQMINHYHAILNGSTTYGLELLFINDTPIASATICFDSGAINCFVKEEYRQCGFGQKVIEQLISKYQLDKHHIYGSAGIDGSEHFYHKMGVGYFKDGTFPIKQEEITALMNHILHIDDIKKNRISEQLNLKLKP